MRSPASMIASYAESREQIKLDYSGSPLYEYQTSVWLSSPLSLSYDPNAFQFPPVVVPAVRRYASSPLIQSSRGGVKMS